MTSELVAPKTVRRSTIELLAAAERDLKTFEQMQSAIRNRRHSFNEEEDATLKMSVGHFEVMINNSTGLGDAIIQAQIDRLRNFLTGYGVSL